MSVRRVKWDPRKKSIFGASFIILVNYRGGFCFCLEDKKSIILQPLGPKLNFILCESQCDIRFCEVRIFR